MATIITKASDKSQYLLEGGKLVKIYAVSNHRAPHLLVDDATFTNLTTAYGAVVGT